MTRSFPKFASRQMAVVMVLLATVAAAAEPPTANPNPQAVTSHASIAIVEMVGQAESAAQHEAVAQAYERDAVRFQADASDHEALAAQYRKSRNYLRWHDTMSQLASHCDSIAKSLKQAATDSRDLAQMHRDIAKLHAADKR